jgi:hypothetical protein
MPFATDVDLLLVFPGLSTTDPALRALMLEQAQCQFNACAWGCSLLLGHVYLTAHMLSVVAGGASNGAGGDITSKTMGPVSIGYSAPAALTNGGAFGDTAAGRQYLALRDALGPMPMGPNGFDCGDFFAAAGCGCP